MIIVTGATGNIGGELVRLLVERGVKVRALSRNPPGTGSPSGVEWVAVDLAERPRLTEIFEGAARLFLLTGNVADMVRLQKNAIEAAEEAGVRHVVKVSALGASDHSKSVIGLWHYNVERVLRAASLDWTILRPHVFMQNLLEQAESIRDEGKLYSPSGAARIPMIDTRDIAAVAAAILTEAEHAGKRYTLTGPEPLSYEEAARILSDAIGQKLTYVAETYDQTWVRRRLLGDPPWLIAAQLALAGYQREGGGTDIITDAVDRIAGRPPHTFSEFARDHASSFRG